MATKTASNGLRSRDADEGDARFVLLREDEAASVLACSPKYLRNLRCRGGSLPYVKINRAVRYRLSDLRALVESSVRRSTSQIVDGPDQMPSATKGSSISI